MNVYNDLDLEYIFSVLPEIRRIIFSYLCQYNDNIFIFRQVSKSFYYMPLYTKIKVSDQPLSFLKKFIKINPIHYLSITKYNRYLLKLPLTFFNSLQKIKIESFNTKQLYFFCKYFSVLPITNLKIKYCEDKIPQNILQFEHLQRLDITVTCKQNEDLVLNLLRTNQKMLCKLKINCYANMNIDIKKFSEMIAKHLSLEILDCSRNLLIPKMMTPKLKYLRCHFSYAPEYLYYSKRLRTINMYNISNLDLEIIFETLECIEWVYLSGKNTNIDSLPYSDEYKYKKLIWNPQLDEKWESYDGSSCLISVKSQFLKSLYLTNFTIKKFEMSRPELLRSIYFIDICILTRLYLPKVETFKIENFSINPLTLDLDNFRFPKLKNLNLSCCLLSKPFFFPSIRSLNLHNSIIENVDILLLLRRHKKLKDTFFYHNDWNGQLENRKLQTFLHSQKIKYYEPDMW